ncbi:uncharacterized protein LOC130988277 [Salvia miltiorrhiza]|uniref:uncharacterized protein LOC130988277 n=1 Tax=Salvia miltiorrhiza TaxID=226208 RepID=UPI0025ABD960|nr:uncharacterized protein LOC130988277 [Salvia miltiorrhiza]
MVAYGFVYALQCWAYEVMPALGTYCASLNAARLTSFPRIMKWIVTRSLILEDDGLRKFFLAEHGCEPVRMSLSSSEIKNLVQLGITPSMAVASPSPFVEKTKNVGRKLVFDSGERTKSSSKKQNSKRKSLRLGSSPCRNTSAKSVDLEDCEIIEPHELKRLVPKLKKSRGGQIHVSENTPRSDRHSNTHLVTPEGSSLIVDAKLNDITNMFLSLKGQIKCLEEYIELKLKNFEVMIKKCGGGICCSCEQKVFKNVMDDVDRKKISDRNDVAADLFCMKPNPSAVFAEKAFGLCMYDPNEYNMSSAQLVPFAEWVLHTTNNPRENLVLLPTEILQYADLGWFNTLLSPDGWLDNMHIDALINLLIINFDKHSGITNHRRWACLEICCWQTLGSPNVEDFLPIMMPYVQGERPVSGGLRWCEVDHIFGIANVHNSHWIFFDVSLDEQLITVYNSLEQDWEDILAHFANIRKNIPILCRLGGLWDSSTCERKPLKMSWNVVNYSGAPKQVNLSDCGIMAVKFMECRAYNVSVLEINPIRCEDSRKGYCAKLFELSKELTATLLDS